MSQILITGITGLIGHHLMQRLQADKQFSIKGQYHSPRDVTSYEKLGIAMQRADICKAEDIRGLCSGCEIVVHSAARVIDFGSREDFYLAHYHATQWLLDDALKAGVKHFIYLSSFGPATHLDRSRASITGFPDETVPLKKVGIHYDDVKVDTEILVKDFCTRHHMAYTIIRPAAVIGPDSVWVREPLKRAQSKLGLKLISGGTKDACLISADNLADGIYRTITLPQAKNQTYFFYDEYGISWAQYFNELLAMKGLKPKGSILRPIALTMARVAEFVFPLFGKQPPLSVKSVVATSTERRVDVSKARNELGWQSQTSYQDAMSEIRQSLISD